MFRRFFCTFAAVLLVVCSSDAPAVSPESGPRQPGSSDASSSPFTHMIAHETEYYTTGPQQGRPSDGTFRAGTRVEVLEEAGSYTLVRSEGGVRAYVASDSVKEAEGVAVPGIVKGGNQFALELYRQLRAEKGNLFCSPSSISVALAMTYAGAEGTTETQMADTLHFPMPEPELHEGMQSLVSLWKASGGEKGYRQRLTRRRRTSRV